MNLPEPKHTPGPWRWIKPRNSNAMLHLVGPSFDETKHGCFSSGSGEICDFGNCETYYPTEGTEPNEKDQQLIAAAPDLLAFALDVMKHKNGLPAELLDQGKMTIIKACGSNLLSGA